MNAGRKLYPGGLGDESPNVLQPVRSPNPRRQPNKALDGKALEGLALKSFVLGFSKGFLWAGRYPSCSNACRDSIIFTGLIGRKVRDTRTSPARLQRV